MNELSLGVCGSVFSLTDSHEHVVKVQTSRFEHTEHLQSHRRFAVKGTVVCRTIWRTTRRKAVAPTSKRPSAAMRRKRLSNVAMR